MGISLSFCHCRHRRQLLLPGLCYWRLCVRPDAPLRWVALALFLLGLVIAVLSITLILVK